MPELWSFENYTPENHNQLIADLKKENEELKAMLSSSQTLCLLIKEQLDKCSCDEDPLPSPPPRREHRRASP